MNNEEIFNSMANKIIKAIDEIETTTNREQIIKLAVMMYLYKSLESEEVFNNNCEILNKTKVKYYRLNKGDK